MPIASGRFIGTSPRPAAVWVLGRWLKNGTTFKPVVFYKPAGSPTWEIVYLGADTADADNLQFVVGVRNPRDPAGVIHVTADYQDNDAPVADAFAFRAQHILARSEDGGASWTYPGITTANTLVQSEESTASGALSLYNSPDLQALTTQLWSFAPGEVTMLAKSRTGSVSKNSADWYTYDMVMMTSSAGGALLEGSTVAEIVAYDTNFNPDASVGFYAIRFSTIKEPFAHAPRALYSPSPLPQPANLYAGQLVLTNGVDGVGHVPAYYHLTLTASAGSLDSSLPVDPIAAAQHPAIWDGAHYYIGAKTTGNQQILVRSSGDASGPWETVYTGGTVTLGAGASRRRGKLVLAGKGTSGDGGQIWIGDDQWQPADLNFTSLGFFGTKYYGVVGTVVYSSANGVEWDSEDLPVVANLQILSDVFGG